MNNENENTNLCNFEGGDKKRAKLRILGLDIIRSLAILFVIAGHFFVLHTPFRSTNFEGLSLFLQAGIIPLFQTGVPLFIMLTGYLNTNKVSEKKYYRGIWKVLIAYVFFSILTLVFRKYYLYEDLSLFKSGLKILDFSAIPYAWYIEMWIGLFLFTPFLNLLYKAIPTQKQKMVWIGILFAMTAIPDLFNRYGFHLVPGFWQTCYPLMFFFIGSYVKEYQPKINPLCGWGIIIICCLINPVFNILFVHNRPLIHIAGDPSGMFGTIIAVIFFLLVYQRDIQVPLMRKIFTKVSLLSLDVYLCCYIFDAIYYPWFKEHYFINQSQFGMFFFVIVPLVFISSLVLAQIKEWLFKLSESHTSRKRIAYR
ncbi:acyltransferase [Bacteroides finegoldii]|uniref:acyltransferase n=1 Tax=Bacteroides finegoldii TaxID=338188 RepID=UPI001EFF7B8E|nr:acyltransferase family protein [Bacteroides finegoldii]